MTSFMGKPPGNAPVGAQGLTVMADIAAVASSGVPAQERAQQVLDRLKACFSVDAAMLSHVDPSTGARRTLANDGYGERLCEHLNGAEFHRDLIQPYAVPRKGWPFREYDLPVDPLSFRSVSEYFRPAGLHEGMTSALFSDDGRYVGFLDVSTMHGQHLSDEACAVVGYLARALAKVVDPLESARRLTAMLAEGSVALGLIGDGRTIALHGAPDDLLLEQSQAIGRAALRMLEEHSAAAFLWPTGSGWYGCRAFQCRDGMTVLTAERCKPPYSLTRRELEVLSCLVKGDSNACIADRMCVAARTVKAHVEHILEKLEVPTRAAAVGRAVQEGLLLPPSD